MILTVSMSPLEGCPAVNTAGLVAAPGAVPPTSSATAGESGSGGRREVARCLAHRPEGGRGHSDGHGDGEQPDATDTPTEEPPGTECDDAEQADGERPAYAARSRRRLERSSRYRRSSAADRPSSGPTGSARAQSTLGFRRHVAAPVADVDRVGLRGDVLARRK
jgi:hypothetical protein